MARPEVERFNSKWVLSESGCHVWQAGVMGNGRGGFWLNGKTLQAHRVAWVFHHGKEPSGFLCHTCDNPLCVNPLHLFEGTAADNSADMVKKGRSVRGEKSPHSKLVKADVIEIRSRRAAGETYKSIANDYPVSLQAIQYICKGKTWRDLK